jgi:hypothetical protein
MQNAYHGHGRRPCSTRGRVARVLLTAAIVVHVATLPACANADRVTATYGEDTELVGLWLGPMVGPYGDSVVWLRLHADSTMTVDNENRNYRHLDGVWTVSANRFVATGTPGDDVVVTLIADAPFTRLTGTWHSHGASGTFDLSKR